ncbi:MAG: hypothetical protein IJU69_01665 [Bacteroidales bacterium]|nr:hypothetical protein [Bacteroidales bacterium]
MNTKPAICLLLLLFLAQGPLSGQTRNYKRVCGGRASTVVYSESEVPEGTQLYICIGSQKTWQVYDRNFNTLWWHFTDSSKKSDLTYRREGDEYVIEGVLGGKPVSQRIKSKGRLWCQNLPNVCGLIFSRRRKLDYEVFRPGTTNLYPMTATLKGSRNWGGSKACRVYVTPAGSLAKFWHCNYYYDPETLVFSGYSAIEGKPPLPLTTWVLQK